MSSRSKPAGRFAAGLVGGSPANPRRFLEHVPEKWTRFSDEDMLQVLEHVPEKWTRFSDKDMLPKFLNWREFFSIR
jgi:hypothetical protein